MRQTHHAEPTWLLPPPLDDTRAGDAACGSGRGLLDTVRHGDVAVRVRGGSTRLEESSDGDNRRLGTAGAALAGAALLPDASEGMTGARGTAGGLGVGKLRGAASPSSPLSLVDGEKEPASEPSESDLSEFEPPADSAGLGGRAPKARIGVPIRICEDAGGVCWVGWPLTSSWFWTQPRWVEQRPSYAVLW